MGLVLEAVGIDDAVAAVYEALVDQPRASIGELAAATGAGPAQLRRQLGRLETLGLVTRLAGHPTRYAPAPPDLALDALVLRRAQELDAVRLTGRRLAERFQSRARPAQPSELVEIITGAEAIGAHLAQLQRGARTEILLTDRPPYLYVEPELNTDELDALARGVAVRCVYHQGGLEAPGRMAQLARYLSAGETARAHPEVAVKMLIVDRRVAMVPMNTAPDALAGSVLLHPSPLLDALVVCFEALWTQAVRLDRPRPPKAGEAGPSEAQLALLRLLAAGATDTRAAQALGISPRTVLRQLDAINRALGARTRFQTALQAARRGWL